MAGSMFLRDMYTTKFEMTRINTIRTEVKKIRKRFNKYMEELPQKLTKSWEDDEKSEKSKISRDTAKKKLERFMERSKIYRLKVLEDLTNEIYRDCWYVRSELEMSITIFKIGLFAPFVKYDQKWEHKQNDSLNPIVLRLPKPKKPKKKNFGVKDITYDIAEAVEKMVSPLTEKFDELENNLKKISVIKELLELEKEMVDIISRGENISETEKKYIETIERIHKKKAPFTNYYRKLLIARNIITQITQSVSPRVTYLEFREKLLSEQNAS